ncbi:unnamed protein product, partial [Symbiodinium sp. CCMP2456]
EKLQRTAASILSLVLGSMRSPLTQRRTSLRTRSGSTSLTTPSTAARGRFWTVWRLVSGACRVELPIHGSAPPICG